MPCPRQLDVVVGTVVSTKVDIPLDRFAFVVGITGHRDLAPEYALELRAQFDAILTELAASYPNTPLVVLSSLAAGADLLAADVAFERELPVIACLPMPVETFAGDFTAPEERARFLAAVQRCARVDVVSSAGERAQGYIDASMYVAYYSDVVVAFWDGGPGRGRGGTADVVTLRMSGMLEEHLEFTSIPYLPDIGPVYQLVTPRAGEAPPAGALTLVKRFPRLPANDQPLEAEFALAVARLERLNGDLDRVAGGATTIDGLRDRTDALCTGLQRRTFFCLYCLYATAVVATAAQYTTSPLVKIAMFPFAFAVYRIAKHFDYENRYQDYRALAEGLRVQAAWLSGGLRDQAERCYLGMQQPELQWIRMALRYAYLAFHSAAAGGSVNSAACRDWIAGQWNYFRTQPRREARWLGQLETASRAAFYTAILVSAVLFAILFLPTMPQGVADGAAAAAGAAWLPTFLREWLRALAEHSHALQTAWDASAWMHSAAFTAERQWETLPLKDGRPTNGDHEWLERLSTGVLALYAAVALLISNYCDKRGFAQNIKRYDRMFRVYDQAKRHLDVIADKNSSAAVEVVAKLGRDALAENGEWLLTRRERPLNFVS